MTLWAYCTVGTDVEFSLLASACQGHLVGVCLHGVGDHTVALAVVVFARRLFIFFENAGLPKLEAWSLEWTRDHRPLVPGEKK